VDFVFGSSFEWNGFVCGIKLLDRLVNSVSIGHNSLPTGAQMIWLQSV
jgi:hypothetical protein